MLSCTQLLKIATNCPKLPKTKTRMQFLHCKHCLTWRCCSRDMGCFALRSSTPCLWSSLYSVTGAFWWPSDARIKWTQLTLAVTVDKLDVRRLQDRP